MYVAVLTIFGHTFHSIVISDKSTAIFQDKVNNSLSDLNVTNGICYFYILENYVPLISNFQPMFELG